ncbi:MULTISPECIES: hypothetical protein [unclassified Exiguobacterium]|uniref:hypothetical protein n=1 Tax=unclassified Exiguobacterium TaxID=2644629 RepID=UPI001BE901D3|nr:MULTISPECIES: hypothetical protein [unclassified Exiguobacterium]
MKKKKHNSWIIAIGAASGLIGMLFGIYFTEGLDWASISGAITGFIFLFLINFFYVRSKKDQTPEVDERTINNIRKYYAIIANVFIGALFIILCMVSYMGHDQIAISYLWIFVISYMLISGMGAFIVSRR